MTEILLDTGLVTKDGGDGGDEVLAPWKNLQLLLGLTLDVLQTLSKRKAVTSVPVTHACISVDAVQQQPPTRTKSDLARGGVDVVRY